MTQTYNIDCAVHKTKSLIMSFEKEDTIALHNSAANLEYMESIARSYSFFFRMYVSSKIVQFSFLFLQVFYCVLYSKSSLIRTPAYSVFAEIWSGNRVGEGKAVRASRLGNICCESFIKCPVSVLVNLMRSLTTWRCHENIQR